VIRLVGSDASSRFVPLGIGKSVVIDLPRDVKDVLVADPLTANAVIRSARRAYIIGVKVGQTNVFFFDADGEQIGGLDIAVTRNLNGLRAAIKQAVPNADIQVEGLGEGLVLTGNAATPLEAQTAFDIASRLVDDGKKVVNSITVHGRDQIMLKVTVAEMQRDVIKARRQSEWQHGLRPLGAEFQHRQYVLGQWTTAEQHRLQTVARWAVPIPIRIRSSFQGWQRPVSEHDSGNVARDGAQWRGAHAGRADADGDLRWRSANFLGWRRVPSHYREQLHDAHILHGYG